MDINIYGKALKPCRDTATTGYERTGYCESPWADVGNHSVCAVITDEFLEFTRSKGNDLITPRPELGFPGLKAGERWCVSALRWQEAFEAGVAPPVIMESTSARVLDNLKFNDLASHEWGKIKK